MTSVHFLLYSHLRFIDTAEEYPEMLADMTTSFAVQLMERSMCSYLSDLPMNALR